jgi:hypothetical protein
MLIIALILFAVCLPPASMAELRDSKPQCDEISDTLLQKYIFQATSALTYDAGGNPIKKEQENQVYVQLNGIGNTLEFSNIPGGPEEEAVLFIHYSFWNYDSKVGIIEVNGYKTEVSFKGTSSWDRYRYIQQEIKLHPGHSNSIIIRSEEKHFPRIDHIIVLPITPEPKYFLSDREFIFLPVKGSMNQLQIISNSSWNILSIPEWLKADQKSGTLLEKVLLTTSFSNIQSTSRTGMIEILFNQSDTARVKVVQESQQKHTYYVDADNGRDDYPGLSPDSAWKTICKVNSMRFGPGDSVLFKNGGKWIGPLNPSGSGTSEELLVFSQYGVDGDKPLIHANGTDQAVMLMNMEHVVLENFRLTNPSDAPDRRARGIYIVANQPKAYKNITIRNNEIYNVIGWVQQNKRFSSGAIFIDSEGNQARFENILIENNWIHDCTTRGITGNAGASNWLDTNYLHNHVIIRGNLIDNTGCDGIRTIASKNVLVENNRVFRVGNYTMGEEALYIAACFPQHCGNTTWQYNEIAYTAPTYPGAGDMDSQAFDIDHDCIGTHIFQYNYSHDNTGGFFLLMGSSIQNVEMGKFERAIIRYNISQNDGNSFPRIFELHDFVNTDLDIQVYNNVFWYDTSTMTIQCKGSYFGGIVFTNNIFYAPSGTYSNQIELNNNLYYPHNPPEHDPSPINEDPLFIDAGSGSEGFNTLAGYQLQPNSPAIGAGVQIIENGSQDFWGNIVSEDYPPCIGAHQFNINTKIPGKVFYDRLLVKEIIPNPFTNTVTITYFLSERTKIRIQIFNQKGKLVKCLVDEETYEGTHKLIWNAEDNFGNPVLPGIYFCSLNTSSSIKCLKLILL